MTSSVHTSASGSTPLLERSELSLLCGVMSHRSVSAGEQLFHLGDPARNLYLVRSGRVSLSLPLEVQRIRRDLTVEVEGPGAIIGWSALVAPYHHTASARVIEDGTLGVIDGADLDALLELHPRTHARLSTVIARVMAERLARWQALAVRSAMRWVGLV